MRGILAFVSAFTAERGIRATASDDEQQSGKVATSLSQRARSDGSAGRIG